MIKTRLVKLLSHAGKYILYDIFWQWGALVAQIVIVFILSGLLGDFYEGNVTERLVMKKSGILALVLAGRFLCDNMAAKASYQASVDVKKVLRDKIYEKMLRLGASYHEKIATSEVVQLSTEGVEQLETYFGKYLPQLFYSLLAPVTLFIVLSVTASVKASAVLLICVPLIPISIVVVQKIAKRLLNQYWGIYTGLGDSFLENLQGLVTLKIYQADGRKAQEMDEEAAKFRRITMKVLTMQLNSISVMDIVVYGGAAAGMIVAVNEFLNGRITFVQTMYMVLLASEFFLLLRLLGSFFHIAMNGMAASDKIFYLLDLEEEEMGNAVFNREQLMEFSAEMEEVSFSYQKEREILHGISIKIPSGSFVSLVGESGCGKSTIASLLSGRNRGYDGQITLGGIPAAELSEAEWMRHVTVVRHNSYLFHGTVRDNLKSAKPSSSEKEMKEVLQKVNLWEYLKGQNGLDTTVSENGENFSGGQCQRLSLARALLHDSEMYIFDEATSNIDAESEETIMEVIHELAKKKTVLLISHRLLNVVSSDWIYMLKDGFVVESGTHQDLMAEKGAYCHLYESQKKLEEFGKGRETVG